MIGWIAAVWFELPTCAGAVCSILPLVQAQATEQYEQEFEAFQSGKYKESAQNWLQSSWQGDALQACHILTHSIRPSVSLFVHLATHSSSPPSNHSFSQMMTMFNVRSHGC